MCAFYLHPLAGKEVAAKSREMAENSMNLPSIPWPALLSAPCGPKPLSSEPVLGMTLHRKSVQPVGSPRSPPRRLLALGTDSMDKGDPALSPRTPAALRAKEPLPLLPPLHPLCLAVNLWGFCHTLLHLTFSLFYTHNLMSQTQVCVCVHRHNCNQIN